MQLINNKRLKAGEQLSTGLASGSELSVITALFPIYALEMLGDTLPSIDNLRLLFSSPLDIQDVFAFIGDADERGLRNRLTQQYIAKKCEAWLSARAEIAQTTSSSLVHQNLFCSDKIAIQCSADLTASGLGFVNPIRHDMSTCCDEPENIAELKEWFLTQFGTTANMFKTSRKPCLTSCPGSEMKKLRILSITLSYTTCSAIRWANWPRRKLSRPKLESKSIWFGKSSINSRKTAFSAQSTNWKNALCLRSSESTQLISPK